MKIPFVDLKRQYDSIREEVLAAIEEVLQNSSFILGPAVEKFENEFSDYCDSKHTLGVASGTDALFLTLKALEIGEGDEVITVPNTFTATVDAIVKSGAKPVFVEMDQETYNIDVHKIEERITQKTKAIMPVHLYGQPADMDEISRIAKRHSLYVVEDACQAHGARYKNRRVGSLGDAGCFSFFPAKNLGAYGDGGAVVTHNQALAEKIKMLRNYGQRKKYYHECIGYNSRLDSIQATVLSVKLKHLDRWNCLRKQHADQYKKLLANNEILLPKEAPERTHVYHLFVIRTPKREELRRQLASKEIADGLHYPVPVHLQKAYRFLGYKQGDFPITERCADEILSLPMFPELTNEEIKQVSDAIKNGLNPDEKVSLYPL